MTQLTYNSRMIELDGSTVSFLKLSPKHRSKRVVRPPVIAGPFMRYLHAIRWLKFNRLPELR